MLWLSEGRGEPRRSLEESLQCPIGRIPSTRREAPFGEVWTAVQIGKSFVARVQHGLKPLILGWRMRPGLDKLDRTAADALDPFSYRAGFALVKFGRPCGHAVGLARGDSQPPRAQLRIRATSKAPTLWPQKTSPEPIVIR